ncbi:recombination protein RecR [Candidatus Gottesmanbacteria bacterium]|nr:recombination protein RecR [Candidatus Gottesmanbacteria bacterium]
MKILPRSVEKLIEALEKLPGIGPKSARRLTFYLLHVPQTQLDEFGQSLINLKKNTVYCSKCFSIGEEDPCVICASADRDESLILVVEQPIDILSVERTGKYRGVYHVLHGAINPLNNIGPDEIKIAELVKRVQNTQVKELILATNFNMEGEATAMYIKREIEDSRKQHANNSNLIISRLAHGLPVGGDLEYADEVTLGRSLVGRNSF